MRFISRELHFQPRAWTPVLLIGCVALCSAGCGDGRIARYPVQGSVSVDGKPATGAIVIFCPVNATGELEKLRPMGTADSAGNFTLMTIDPEDGAPVGDYKVLVKWPAPASQAETRDGRPGALGPDRLKGKYYNLDTTPLAAKIEPKSNELAPFQLQSK